MKMNERILVVATSLILAACGGVETAGDRPQGEYDPARAADSTLATAVGNSIPANRQFREPDFTLFDALACTPVVCTIAGTAQSSITIGMNLYGLSEISDDIAMDVNGVHCVGECDNVETYNWEEITDNTGFILRLWPNPTHPNWNCRNDFECLKRGGSWNEDCWDHRNIQSFFRPRSFPFYITHAEFITYNLDFTCRVAQRACQYRVNQNYSIDFLGCTGINDTFGAQCDHNIWNTCQ